MLLIGTRVKVIRDEVTDNGVELTGRTGKICKICDDSRLSSDGIRLLGIWFDRSFEDGHDCEGTCPTGHGWNMYEDELEVIEPIKTKFKNAKGTGIKINSTAILTNELLKNLKELKESFKKQKIKEIEYQTVGGSIENHDKTSGKLFFFNYSLPDVDDVIGKDRIVLWEKEYKLEYQSGGTYILQTNTPETFEKSLYDDEGNLLVAIKGNNVFVTFNIDGMKDTPNNKRFLKAVFDWMKKEGFAPEDKKTRLKNERKALQVWMGKTINKNMENKRKQLQDTERQSHEYQMAFIDGIRKIEKINKELISLESEKKKPSDIMEMFSKIYQNPNIAKIYHSPKGDRLCVETNPLKITSCKTSKSYDIGRYSISIGLDGCIEIDTLDANKENLMDVQHPHVHNKHVCWGNISESVTKLMADWKIDAVLVLTIRLLERYNSESPYMSLNDFMERGFGVHITCEPKH